MDEENEKRNKNNLEMLKNILGNLFLDIPIGLDTNLNRNILSILNSGIIFQIWSDDRKHIPGPGPGIPIILREMTNSDTK